MMRPAHIAWPHWIVAVLVALCGGIVTGFAIFLVPVTLVDGFRVVPMVMAVGANVARLFIAVAILPTAAAMLLLLHRGWLRRWHFLATGGIVGAASACLLDLMVGTQSVGSIHFMAGIAFLCGIAGGGLAWAYLWLMRQLPGEVKP